MADTTGEFEDPTLAEQVEEYDRLFGIVGDGVVGAAGGLVGTALMTGVLFVASQLGAFSFESFASLAAPLGLADTARPVLVGYLIFLANGMVPWPLLFAALMEYLPGERPPVSGLFLGGALWTGFVLGFYTGYTGLTLAVYLVFTFVAHLVYGFGVGLVFEYLSNRPDSLV
ncbi:DUF6789 family protein [Halomarina oriensis]|uniref:Uncharacterized protein n=1 Tax=Halomarina oriensis TaxID=671145 RepID=A0A6B0GPL3_9EURY|nr:DUF6789 family protein [Halomarina oriensis]MWG35951.1 hypothetical protein [Halomarina oriensis]